MEASVVASLRQGCGKLETSLRQGGGKDAERWCSFLDQTRHINNKKSLCPGNGYYLDLFEGMLKNTVSVFFSKYFAFLGGGGGGGGGGGIPDSTQTYPNTQKNIIRDPVGVGES